MPKEALSASEKIARDIMEESVIREILRAISKEEYEYLVGELLFVMNTEGQTVASHPRATIGGAFTWKISPQGQDFWHNACKGIIRKDLNNAQAHLD